MNIIFYVFAIKNIKTYLTQLSQCNIISLYNFIITKFRQKDKN